MDTSQITQLLKDHQDGDPAAFERLVPIVYEHLQKMARSQLRRRGSGQTLDTVGLVHEAYLRLVEDIDVDGQSREHFFGVVARAMRFIVIDQVRKRKAQKRGGELDQITLDAEIVGSSDPVDVALAVGRAVDLLSTFNERLARVVECRFFLGMKDGEIANALGLSTRTVQRDWLQARAWLHRVLDEEREQKAQGADGGGEDSEGGGQAD